MRLVLSLLLALPGAALAGPGDRACCVQDIRSGTMFSLSGTVQDFVRGEGMLLRDADGTVHEIRCIGPNRFWRDLGQDRPAVGDRVTVEGYEVQCGQETGNAAARFIIDGQTVELRDSQTGLPLWMRTGGA